jgi:RNA binding exosome subunit
MSSSKPQKAPIGYVSIRVFAHATEDQERVIQAVRNTLPEELAENAVFKKTTLTGHHGNPITIIETELADRQKLTGVLEKIGKDLTSLDKESLNNEMPLHLERGNLYMRFDKQQAFLGQHRFASYDPIHFKVHFRNKTADEIVAVCREAGLLP